MENTKIVECRAICTFNFISILNNIGWLPDLRLHKGLSLPCLPPTAFVLEILHCVTPRVLVTFYFRGSTSDGVGPLAAMILPTLQSMLLLW